MTTHARTHIVNLLGLHSSLRAKSSGTALLCAILLLAQIINWSSRFNHRIKFIWPKTQQLLSIKNNHEPSRNCLVALEMPSWRSHQRGRIGRLVWLMVAIRLNATVVVVVATDCLYKVESIRCGGLILVFRWVGNSYHKPRRWNHGSF